MTTCLRRRTLSLDQAARFRPALTDGGPERSAPWVAEKIRLRRGRLSALSTGEAANRLGDGREPIGEVCAAAAPDSDAFALLAGEDAEAVVLDFVQPAGSGGRSTSVGSHGRTKPTGGIRVQRTGEARASAHAEQSSDRGRCRIGALRRRRRRFKSAPPLPPAPRIFPLPRRNRRVHWHPALCAREGAFAGSKIGRRLPRPPKRNAPTMQRHQRGARAPRHPPLASDGQKLAADLLLGSRGNAAQTL